MDGHLNDTQYIACIAYNAMHCKKKEIHITNNEQHFVYKLFNYLSYISMVVLL